MTTRRIGMLGAGNMAGALIKGMIASGCATGEQIGATDVRGEQLEALTRVHGIKSFAADNDSLVRWADVLFLAVKPQVVGSVLERSSDAFDAHMLVVSIAAGVPTRYLESRLPDATRVVRAMPNTPAIALASATGIAPGRNATEEDLAITKELFGSVGRTVLVQESLLDAVTGLSGSGPAYVMLMIEALADGGVKVGLPRDVSVLLAAQTLYGAAKLALETGEHPGRLKDMVTSPGGTAIAGVHALETGGLRKALIEAVETATRRATELGKRMDV